jgi:hypothetical protein
MMDSLNFDITTSGITSAVQGLTQVANLVSGMGLGATGAAAGGAAGGAASLAILAKFALPLALATAGLYKLQNALNDLVRTSRTLMEVGQTQMRMGSTAGETHFLRALGRAFGVGDVAASARRLRHTALSGLGAEAASRNFGIPMPFDIGRAENEGRMLINALDGLRKTFERNPDQARADLRNLNLEEWAETMLLTDRTWANLKRSLESGVSDRHVKAAAEFNAQMAVLLSRWEALKLAVGGATVGITNWVLEMLAKGGAAFGLPGAIAKNLFGGSDEAANANTRALRQNTNALDQLRRMPGIYGGSHQARNAMPAAFGPGMGKFLNGQFRNGAFNFGAYTIGL